MTTNLESVRQDKSTPSSRSRHDFKGLTKAQLVRRLEYAEFMMIHMRDAYLEYLEKPEPFTFAHDHERGFANAMNMALSFITEDPDRPKISEKVA
jgi:hypothetical protein